MQAKKAISTHLIVFDAIKSNKHFYISGLNFVRQHHSQFTYSQIGVEIQFKNLYDYSPLSETNRR
ncbi:hypothetical protein D3C86_1847350 [compost metagenome]